MAPEKPVVILIRPQMGENIGAAARAMSNCGLDRLRVVAPRDGWPNERALALARTAAPLVEAAQVFDTTAEAVSDISLLFATTARGRDMSKPAVDPMTAAAQMRAAAADGVTSGILFGPERTGLDNDEVVLAQNILHVPLNPDFNSLNLAQAVLLVAWEWHRAGLVAEPPPEDGSGLASFGDGVRPATVAEMANFFDHLEQELDASGFLRVKEKRPTMVRNLRNIFHRAVLSEREVKSLHGVVTYLVGHRKDQSEGRPAAPQQEREPTEEERQAAEEGTGA